MALSGKSLFDLSDDENDFNADDKITSTNYVETEQIIKEVKATSDNLQPYKRKKCRAILELESVRNNDSYSENKTDNNSCDTNLSKDNKEEDGFDFSDDDEFVAAIAEEESSSKETGITHLSLCQNWHKELMKGEISKFNLYYIRIILTVWKEKFVKVDP